MVYSEGLLAFYLLQAGSLYRHLLFSIWSAICLIYPFYMMLLMNSSSYYILCERYYVTFALWHGLSVCRLLSVCNVVAPTWTWAVVTFYANVTTLRLSVVYCLWRCCTLPRRLNFIFAPFVDMGSFVLKLPTKIPRAFRWSYKLNERPWKTGQYLALFRKRYKIRP